MGATLRDFFASTEPGYVSKTKMDECKNEKCKEKRRDHSAYCQKCSDKNKKQSI